MVYGTYMGKLFFSFFTDFFSLMAVAMLIFFLITGFFGFISSPKIFIIHELLNKSDFQMSYDHKRCLFGL